MEDLREAMKELQNLKILETKMNNINDMDISTQLSMTVLKEVISNIKN
ncbi:MAG: hypothetical protein IJU54_02450 [Alphaproteobacteria bacterium]|nr:hypothetical protein [Alphaproteobacteria bacterium]